MSDEPVEKLRVVRRESDIERPESMPMSMSCTRTTFGLATPPYSAVRVPRPRWIPKERVKRCVNLTEAPSVNRSWAFWAMPRAFLPVERKAR